MLHIDDHNYVNGVDPVDKGLQRVFFFIRQGALLDELDLVIPGWSSTARDITGPSGKQGVVVEIRAVVDGKTITRSGVGTRYNGVFDGVVGAFDHAMYRAAAQFGIGRYLLSIPYIDIPIGDDNIMETHPLDALTETLRANNLADQVGGI